VLLATNRTAAQALPVLCCLLQIVPPHRHSQFCAACYKSTLSSIYQSIITPIPIFSPQEPSSRFCITVKRTSAAQRCRTDLRAKASALNPSRNATDHHRPSDPSCYSHCAVSRIPDKMRERFFPPYFTNIPISIEYSPRTDRSYAKWAYLTVQLSRFVQPLDSGTRCRTHRSQSVHDVERGMVTCWWAKKTFHITGRCPSESRYVSDTVLQQLRELGSAQNWETKFSLTIHWLQ